MRTGPPLVLLALCVAVLAAPAQIAVASDEDLSFLLQGVEVVDAPGLPGPVCAFGPEAFAVVVGGVRGGAQLPLVVASRIGEGRVVAFGKDGFLVPDTMTIGDTGRLMLNAVRWAAGEVESPAVGVYRKDAFSDWLAGQGVRCRPVGLADLGSVEVLVGSVHPMSDDELAQVTDFIRGGGGFITGELGWGWLQLNPGKTLTDDFRPNKLLGPMGIAWCDGTLDRTAKSGYAGGEKPSPLTNASAALDAALAHEDGTAKLTSDEIRQVSTVLSRTVQALRPDDGILLPRIRRLVAERPVNVAPSPDAPIEPEHMLARLAMTMQIRETTALPPEAVKALPAAATYPGEVPAEAQTVTRTVTVDTKAPRWHSTGLYAAPGALITVDVPEGAADKGLGVRIGSTTCRNWQHARWLRAPEVARSFAIEQPRTLAANAFGGLIYLTVPDDCQLGAIDVTIAGAVEAPYFVLGETSLDEWRAAIRTRPAPRAELASSKAILTVPSEAIRDLDDPAELMRTWDRVLDLCAELGAWPSTDRKSPERYVADVQICAGYMHAGYPIMLPTSAAPQLIGVNHLVSEGNWGLYHETGHNHQRDDWTFGGTNEVTVNLFTLYVFDRLCGIDPSEGRMSDGNLQKSVIRYFATGRDFGKWKSDPFLALYMYYQMQQAFGWETYQQVFAEYRDLPDDQRPKDDDEKRDQWLVRFSRAAGRNLGLFFEAWGVPTSDEARRSIGDLPPWMPDNFPPEPPTAKRTARNAQAVRVSSENRGDEGGNTVDGFEDTIWHSRWEGENVPGYPHEIVIDLGETLAIAGITVLPRQTGANGWISEYEVYVGDEPNQWAEAVAKGTFGKSKELKTVRFVAPQTCRYVRLVALRGFDDQVWASLAELDVVLP